jgi:hypothetical protein
VNARRNVPSVEGAGTQQPARTPSTQYLAIIDAIRVQQHSEDQRHHLPARVRCSRTIATQPHEPGDQTLDPKPSSERRDQRDPRVGDHPIIIKTDPHATQSDGLLIIHHADDLLMPGRDCPIQSLLPAQEVI